MKDQYSETVTLCIPETSTGTSPNKDVTRKF